MWLLCPECGANAGEVCVKGKARSVRARPCRERIFQDSSSPSAFAHYGATRAEAEARRKQEVIQRELAYATMIQNAESRKHGTKAGAKLGNTGEPSQAPEMLLGVKRIERAAQWPPPHHERQYRSRHRASPDTDA